MSQSKRIGLGYLGNDPNLIKPSDDPNTIPPGTANQAREPFEKTESHFKATTQQVPLTLAQNLVLAQRKLNLKCLEQEVITKKIELLQHKIEAAKLFLQVISKYSGLTPDQQKQISQWIVNQQVPIELLKKKIQLDLQKEITSCEIKRLNQEIDCWKNLKNLGVNPDSKLKWFQPVESQVWLGKPSGQPIPKFTGASPVFKPVSVTGGVATLGGFKEGTVNEVRKFINQLPSNEPPLTLDQQLQGICQQTQTTENNLQQSKKSLNAICQQLQDTKAQISKAAAGLDPQIIHTMGTLVELRPEIFTRQGDLQSLLQAALQTQGDVKNNFQQSQNQAQQALKTLNVKQQQLKQIQSPTSNLGDTSSFMSNIFSWKGAIVAASLIGVGLIAKQYWSQ